MGELEHSLIAYVDGELDPMQAQAIEQLITRDPALQARVREYQETSALLRAACAENFYAGASGGADGLSHLLPPPRPRSPAARALFARRRVAGAIAASLLAGVLGFGGGAYWTARTLPSARDILIAEIAEYHEVYAQETTHLVEVGADRSEALFAWLGERLSRRLSAPDLSTLGLSFAGGRMFVVGGKPVAALMYTRANGRPVALCITTQEGPTSARLVAPAPLAQAQLALRFDEHGPLRLASWDDGPSTYVVVGEVPRHKLQRIASLVMAQGEN